MKNVSVKIRFSRNILLFKFQDSVGNGNMTLRKQLEKCYGVIGTSMYGSSSRNVRGS